MSAQKKSRGFTLIELLVVIAIIAILSVVGIVLFTGVQKGARDARRKGDVDAIAKAYEVKASSGRYWAIADSDFASAKIPQDPNPARGDYFNWLDLNGAGFKVCASLDSNPSNACNTPAANCYCKFSSQGTVPSGSTAAPTSTQSSLGYGGSSSAPSCDPNGTLYAGLVGYWKMDDTSWNGTPGEVFDSSGNGNHGTAAGVASLADHTPDPLGYFKKAGIFDGNSGYVNVGNGASLDITGSYITLEAWINPDVIPFATWGTIVGNMNTYALVAPSGDDEVAFVILETGIGHHQINTVNAGLLAGQWFHIVATFSRPNVLIYVNDIQKGSGTIDLPIPSYPEAKFIGSRTGTMQYFDGLIDDVRIYNRALSPQEVTSLYNSGNGCI